MTSPCYSILFGVNSLFRHDIFKAFWWSVTLNMTREIRRLHSKWPPKTHEICLAFWSGFTTGARKLLWDTTVDIKSGFTTGATKLLWDITVDSKNLQKVRTSNQVQRRTTSQPTLQWLRCWRRPPRCRLSVGRSPCLGRSWPSYCWLGCPFVTMAPREGLEEIASVGKTEGSWCMISWTKWPPFWQTIFSKAFSWMKIRKYRFKFHWNLFPGVQLTINRHWLR